MKAAIRHIHSPDLDLETFRPDDPSDVGFLLQIIAGPSDGPGEESFDVMVVTPSWLRRKVEKDGPLIGRHYLVIAAYDAKSLDRFLRTQIESLVSDDWPTLAEKIGRIGYWEFEDYVP
jgi:hypothetical protein